MIKRIHTYVVILISMFCLTGCGEPMIELTDEEETLIAHSAAYFVAKHNIHQKDGVINVPDDLKQQVESSDSDIILDNNSQTEELTTSPVGGILISCCDKTITKDYIENDAYVIYADVGKSLCIFQIRLQNTSHNDVEINNLVSKPKFQLSYNNKTVMAESTFLNKDLSSYQGIIPAHSTIDAILIFEVNDDDVESLKEIDFQIEGTTIKPTTLSR